MDTSIVAYIATTLYNIKPAEDSIEQLCGYSDRNYAFRDQDEGTRYVLKIVNQDDSDESLTDVIDEILEGIHEFCKSRSNLEFSSAKLLKTTASKLSTRIHVRQFDGNQGETELCNVKLFEFQSGATFYELVTKQHHLYAAEQIHRRMGRLCKQLFKFMRTQHHLQERLNEVRGDSFAWQLSSAPKTIRRLMDKLYPDTGVKRRMMLSQVLDDYDYNCKAIENLPEFMLHSDLSGKNLLVDLEDAESRICIIDFQDVQTGPQIAELSTMILYNVLEQTKMKFEVAIELIPKWTIQGYQSIDQVWNITRDQLLLIPTLMKLRLCQSLLNAQLAHQLDPSNDYVMLTNQRGWLLLELLNNLTVFADGQHLVGLWVE